MSSALENGEVTPQALAEAQAEIARLRKQVEDLVTLVEKREKRIKGLDLQLDAMQKDQERAYLEREEREEAEVLVKVWRKGTKRRRRLDHNDWESVCNAIKRHSFPSVLRAIAGAVYDPGSQTRRNGTTKRYNDIELITRSASKTSDFYDRAPKGWKPDAAKLAEIGGVSEEWVRARVSVRDSD
jgi:hypothetical protein